MRRALLISITIIMAFPWAVNGQQTANEIPLNGFPPRLGYLEYLPPTYHTEAKLFPVLIYLHGGGEAGGGTPEDLERLKVWGPPNHISNGHDMCFTVNNQQECFLVFSPQINSDLYEWESFVSLLIDHILNGPDNYKADPSRIYLTGLSRGGKGVYSFAAHPIYNSPNKLAAIAPISAFADVDDNGCMISSRQIAVWAFHGKQDTVVPYPQGTSAYNSVALCTSPEPVADLIFTSYEDEGKYHDAWIPAYDTSNKFHQPNLYEWLLMHSKPDIVVGTEYVEERSKILFYPNPVSNEIVLNSNDNAGSPSRLTLFDVAGRQIKQFESPAGSRLNVSDIQRGAYFILVEYANGRTETVRIVK
jgi:poly(3-hydroxybutyrate) depolymerase